MTFCLFVFSRVFIERFLLERFLLNNTFWFFWRLLLFVTSVEFLHQRFIPSFQGGIESFLSQTLQLCFIKLSGTFIDQDFILRNI